MSSPAPGRSILITSAPRSASICAQVGPASTRVRSNTRSPRNGPWEVVRWVARQWVRSCVSPACRDPVGGPYRPAAYTPRGDAGNAGHGLTPQRAASIESRASWVAACITLAILSISYGSPLLIVVGMKPIQEALGTERSVLALAGALVWVGTGLGGILMGWLADRIGIRATVDDRRRDDGRRPGAVLHRAASGRSMSGTGC